MKCWNLYVFSTTRELWVQSSYLVYFYPLLSSGLLLGRVVGAMDFMISFYPPFINSSCPPPIPKSFHDINDYRVRLKEMLTLLDVNTTNYLSIRKSYRLLTRIKKKKSRKSVFSRFPLLSRRRNSRLSCNAMRQTKNVLKLHDKQNKNKKRKFLFKNQKSREFLYILSIV